MYVFGTQEAERPIAQSMVLAAKQKTIGVIEEYFGTDEDTSSFTVINSIALAATHLIIICRTKYVPYISNISNESLALGIGDMLTNKGAVCISFKLGKSRLLFINCHLEAHEKNLMRRNEQWR